MACINTLEWGSFGTLKEKMAGVQKKRKRFSSNKAGAADRGKTNYCLYSLISDISTKKLPISQFYLPTTSKQRFPLHHESLPPTSASQRWFLLWVSGYTFRETSPVVNYRNVPWTYSLNQRLSETLKRLQFTPRSSKPALVSAQTRRTSTKNQDCRKCSGTRDLDRVQWTPLAVWWSL